MPEQATQVSGPSGPESLHPERSLPPQEPYNSESLRFGNEGYSGPGLGLSISPPTIHLSNSTWGMPSPEPLLNGQVPRNAYNRAALEEAKFNEVEESTSPHTTDNQDTRKSTAAKIDEIRQEYMSQLQASKTDRSSSPENVAETAVKDVFHETSEAAGMNTAAERRSHPPTERKMTASPALDAVEEEQPSNEASNSKKRRGLPRPTSISMWGGQPADETLTTKKRQRSQTADSKKLVPPSNRAAVGSAEYDQPDKETLITKKRRRVQTTDSDRSVSPVTPAVESRNDSTQDGENDDLGPPKRQPSRPLKHTSPAKAALQVQAWVQEVNDTSGSRLPRGRPPKPKDINSAKASIATKEVKAANSQAQAKDQEVAGRSTSKRPRGRPPKKTSAAKAAETIIKTKAASPQVQVKNQDISKSSIPKRTRGRPPKNAQAQQSNKENKLPIQGNSRIAKPNQPSKPVAATSRHGMRTRTQDSA